MAIPVPWVQLSSEQKRARTLEVADRLFARDGVAVAMPVLADELGVGVGSIYRQFATKDDVIGALVMQRADVLEARFLAALGRPDAWAAMAEAAHATVDDCITDALTQSAWEAASSTSRDVRDARERATRALERMVEHARAEGALRDDATHEDLRLVFCAVRELGDIGPGAAHRLIELVLRGMAAPA